MSAEYAVKDDNNDKADAIIIVLIDLFLTIELFFFMFASLY